MNNRSSIGITNSDLEEYKIFAAYLSIELGVKISVPTAIKYAVDYYKEKNDL